MSNLFLPSEDIDELKSIAEAHSDPRTRNQAKAILALFDGGKTKQDIADSVGMTRSGLWRLQKRFEEKGIALFAGESKVGRPPKVTAEYRKELDLALQSNPRALGLSNDVAWSAEILLDYMTDKTGLELSIWTLRDLLHKMGYEYRWRRVIVTVNGIDRRNAVMSWNKSDGSLVDRYTRS